MDHALEDFQFAWTQLRSPSPLANRELDMYFAPKQPEGVSEKNWIKTDPEKGFLVVFRFSGPLEGYIEKTWKLNDFQAL